MTDERLKQIRARHRLVDAGDYWFGYETFDGDCDAIFAFEDRADLLDEVDRLRGKEQRLARALTMSITYIERQPLLNAEAEISQCALLQMFRDALTGAAP